MTTRPIAESYARRDHVALVLADRLTEWTGLAEYAGVLSSDGLPESIAPAISAVQQLDYLGDGDVVRLHPSGRVRVLYRHSTACNTILTTERCNSYCLMCSQPPKEVDDSWRVAEILRLIELIDLAAPEIILSGGEPTLLGESFFTIVEKLARVLPTTGLHILTNGRTFEDARWAARLRSINHPDLVLGIPLYSDIDHLHDYVVQAEGAWAQTMRGLYALARVGMRIEVRVVLHQQTFERLPQLAEFLYRNLPFVQHVALMGLEMFGLTHKNLPILWIDPADYASQLETAVTRLATRGMNVSIYNHQLCTIPRSLWPFARSSISDWKRVYLEPCEGCGVREYCGGFFQSARKRHSQHIRTLPPLSDAADAAMRELAGLTTPVEVYSVSSRS